MPADTPYDQAWRALGDALTYAEDPPGQALDAPTAYAQVMATIRLGNAILALCDQLETNRRG
jgi:hypothetical protein